MPSGALRGLVGDGELVVAGADLRISEEWGTESCLSPVCAMSLGRLSSRLPSGQVRVKGLTCFVLQVALAVLLAWDGGDGRVPMQLDQVGQQGALLGIRLLVVLERRCRLVVARTNAYKQQESTPA